MGQKVSYPEGDHEELDECLLFHHIKESTIPINNNQPSFTKQTCNMLLNLDIIKQSAQEEHMIREPIKDPVRRIQNTQTTLINKQPEKTITIHKSKSDIFIPQLALNNEENKDDIIMPLEVMSIERPTAIFKSESVQLKSEAIQNKEVKQPKSPMHVPQSEQLSNRQRISLMNGDQQQKSQEIIIMDQGEEIKTSPRELALFLQQQYLKKLSNKEQFLASSASKRVLIVNVQENIIPQETKLSFFPPGVDAAVQTSQTEIVEQEKELNLDDFLD